MIQDNLITAWRGFAPRVPPFLLEGDELLLRDNRSVTIPSIKALLRHRDFDFSRRPTLHLGLLPVPFVGDLKRADIFILLQNPGFSPSNYFQEFQDQAFRRALRENLRQPRASRRFPFFPLNPRFCYGGSYEYWRSKFGGILTELMRRRGLPLVRALELLSSRVAILELFPYHSSIGPLPNSLLRRLRSVELARSYVHDTLLPRARSGDAVLIVTRKARQWGLTARKGVVIYNGSEARSAHLSLNSRGGAEMLKHLL